MNSSSGGGGGGGSSDHYSGGGGDDISGFSRGEPACDNNGTTTTSPSFVVPSAGSLWRRSNALDSPSTLSSIGGGGWLSHTTFPATTPVMENANNSTTVEKDLFSAATSDATATIVRPAVVLKPGQMKAFQI
jgi:hypothetical protein